MSSAKTLLRPLVPPAALALLRRMVHPVVGFSGDYDSWEAASAAASGYGSEEILHRVISATRRVVAGKAQHERDSVIFDEIEYSWPLLASLLQVALESGSLRVVDFGGSLGSTWRQNRRFLQRLRVPIMWHVVEQERFVAAGRKEFADEVLRFSHTIREAAGDGVDVILSSSSLCYVPDPVAVLDEAAETDARYLIIDRLPLVPGGRDRIALQRVSEPIYTARYPIRLFGAESVLDGLLGRWRLIERWECDLQPDSNSKCHGLFMEKR